MPEVYLIAAVRTPIGVGKPQTGALFPVAPVDLAAHVLAEVIRRGGRRADSKQHEAPQDMRPSVHSTAPLPSVGRLPFPRAVRSRACDCRPGDAC